MAINKTFCKFLFRKQNSAKAKSQMSKHNILFVYNSTQSKKKSDAKTKCPFDCCSFRVPQIYLIQTLCDMNISITNLLCKTTITIKHWRFCYLYAYYTA